MDAGVWHTCAVASHKTLECWDTDIDGSLTPVGGPAVAAGTWHTCWIHGDPGQTPPIHKVTCTGDNSFDQAVWKNKAL